jgi:hypothetical protein
MSREQWLTLGMAAATVVALVLAAFGFSKAGIEWGARVVARGLELYYGGFDRLETRLALLQEQSDRDLKDYEALKRLYIQLAHDYEALQHLASEQAERLKQLERYHNEQGRT